MPSGAKIIFGCYENTLLHSHVGGLVTETMPTTYPQLIYFSFLQWSRIVLQLIKPGLGYLDRIGEEFYLFKLFHPLPPC
jgi:hypothetical protein